MSDVDVWMPARQNPLDWQFLNKGFQHYQALGRLKSDAFLIAKAQTEQAFEDMERLVGYEYSARPVRTFDAWA